MSSVVDLNVQKQNPSYEYCQKKAANDIDGTEILRGDGFNIREFLQQRNLKIGHKIPTRYSQLLKKDLERPSAVYIQSRRSGYFRVPDQPLTLNVIGSLSDMEHFVLGHKFQHRLEKVLESRK